MKFLDKMTNLYMITIKLEIKIYLLAFTKLLLKGL